MFTGPPVSQLGPHLAYSDNIYNKLCDITHQHSTCSVLTGPFCSCVHSAAVSPPQAPLPPQPHPILGPPLQKSPTTYNQPTNLQCVDGFLCPWVQQQHSPLTVTSKQHMQLLASKCGGGGGRWLVCARGVCVLGGGVRGVLKVGKRHHGSSVLKDKRVVSFWWWAKHAQLAPAPLPLHTHRGTHAHTP